MPTRTPVRRSSKAISKEPHPHSWRGMAGVIGASLAMIIMAPIFVLAVETEEVQDDGTILGVMRELRREMGELRSRVENIDAKLDEISSAPATVDPAFASAGIPECVATCQARGIECLKSSTTPPSTSASATSTPPAIIAKETACRRQTDACIQACRPPRNAPVVAPSCETTCAVSMNACVRAAGNDVSAAERCRLVNRFCLAERCVRPPAPSLIVAASKIPVGMCASQCRRGYAICADRVRYDIVGLEECKTVLKVCEEVACKDDERPIGEEIVQQCEDGCTASFDRCRASAGTNASRQKLCDTAYGQCRDLCRQQTGGGTNTTNR